MEDSGNDSGNDSDRTQLIRQKSLDTGLEIPNVIQFQTKEKKQIQFVFNTSDSSEVRDCITELIKTLLGNPNCEISIGLISNTGFKGDNPNLQELSFSKNADEISKTLKDSVGEGKNWKKYFGFVLDKASSSFKWTPKPPNKLCFLILFGSNESVDALTISLNEHLDFNSSIEKLKKNGVGVFAFNPQQLDLLVDVVSKYLS